MPTKLLEVLIKDEIKVKKKKKPGPVAFAYNSSCLVGKEGDSPEPKI